jgi:putative membrane protein (TIGR04086 family)
MTESELGFESYFGVALFTCGIIWLWDYLSSLFFPGQTALNLTLLSSFIYLEASFIGAYGLARKRLQNQVNIGLRVGIAAFLVNLVFRLIVFEIAEALWGLIIYLIFLIIGGALGGLFAKKIYRK